eukprot:TRINITY_DN10040_c0_g1_i1.p2 TRINITY_DN10040_c0_g1~~TRINITY_DN10040_c0_g1_i1.p2  ORF type:complete len:196 (-),score=22.41 TRINITY_DN10040_c0_g1_i1:253-840(-)
MPAGEELGVALDGGAERAGRWGLCCETAGACQDGNTVDVKWHGEAFDPVSGEWRAIAEPLQQAARTAHSCVAVGSLLFVLGGKIGGMRIKVLDSVEVLDTVSGIWSTAAPMPTPRHSVSCVVVGNLIYVIDGHYYSSRWRNLEEVLDTVSGTWSTAPLPIDAPSTVEPVLCEYIEQPSARYTSGEVSANNASGVR